MGPVNKRGNLKKKLTILPPPAAGMEDLKAQWERAWEALQKAYDDLEQRIEERTAELMKANAHLVQEIEERQRTENELQRIKEYLENVIDNSVDEHIMDRIPRASFREPKNTRRESLNATTLGSRR